MGSPKNPKPIINVMLFTTISDVVKADTPRTGTRIPASLKRGASLGKGAVGDKALVEALDLHFVHWSWEMYLAKRSQPSAISPRTCMTGLILDHIISSIGCLVLSC